MNMSTDTSNMPPGYGKYFGPNYYGEQDENGIDLSLIRSNLKLTPLERARRGDAATNDALRLLEHGRRHREKSLCSNR
jgi:hypothetical protein